MALRDHPPATPTPATGDRRVELRMSDFSWWRSIKARVTLFTLVIFVISIWSLAFYVSRTLREDMQRVMGEQQFSTASLLAAEINGRLQDRLDALVVTAKQLSPEVLAKTEAVQAFLEERPILLTLFNSGTFVTGIDGTAVADFPKIPGRVGTNYLDRESVSIPLKEGVSAIGRPVMGKTLNAPVFSIVVPIRNGQGGVIGALVGTVNLGLPSFLDKIAGSQYGRTGGYLLVDAKHGLFVTATDKTRVMQAVPAPGTSPVFDRRMKGFYGPEVAVNSLGVENLASAAPIPVAGWFVITSMPTQEAFAPIRNVVQRTMVAAALLTLLTGGVTWWWLKRQLAPMLMTVKTLTVQSQLDTPPQPLPITSRDELGNLIGGFNRLTERLRQREVALHESELYKQAILNSVDVEIVVLDQYGVIQAVNQPWLRFAADNTNDPDQTVPSVGVGTNYLAICKSAADLSMDGAQETLDGIMGVLDGRLPSFTSDYVCPSPTQQRWFNMTVTPLTANGGTSVVVGHIDITERKEAEVALKNSEKSLRISEEQMSISQRISGTGSWVYNLETDSIWGSAEGFRIFGFPAVAGDFPIDRIEACIPERERVHQALVDLISEGRDYDLEYAINPLDGSPSRIIHSIARLERSAEGEPSLVLGFIQDITERSRMEEQVRQLAFFDPLTQLPNRRLLDDRLTHVMAASSRRGVHGALLFVDLDNFKSLNDAHGHAVGDLLLIEATNRLKHCVREMDTVSRFGGDEFVVLLSELAMDKAEAMEEAHMISEKICVSLARPYVLTIKRVEAADTTVEHHCTASIGAVTFAGHEASPSDLIRWADSAMYQAKAAGRNAVRFHEATTYSWTTPFGQTE